MELHFFPARSRSRHDSTSSSATVFSTGTSHGSSDQKKKTGETENQKAPTPLDIDITQNTHVTAPRHGELVAPLHDRTVVDKVAHTNPPISMQTESKPTSVWCGADTWKNEKRAAVLFKALNIHATHASNHARTAELKRKKREAAMENMQASGIICLPPPCYAPREITHSSKRA